MLPFVVDEVEAVTFVQREFSVGTYEGYTVGNGLCDDKAVVRVAVVVVKWQACKAF